MANWRMPVMGCCGTCGGWASLSSRDTQLRAGTRRIGTPAYSAAAAACGVAIGDAGPVVDAVVDALKAEGVCAVAAGTVCPRGATRVRAGAACWATFRKQAAKSLSALLNVLGESVCRRGYKSQAKGKQQQGSSSLHG